MKLSLCVFMAERGAVSTVPFFYKIFGNIKITIFVYSFGQVNPKNK
jgi:hypothetical protein